MSPHPIVARTDDREAGVVLVWMSLMIAVLLGMAGLSLDVANWYLQGNREQKAADAAALAGAVYLPDDPGRAFSTARDLASRNGYTADTHTTVIARTQCPPVWGQCSGNVHPARPWLDAYATG